MTKNVQVKLARRPSGWVTPDDFSIERADIPQPGPGDVIVRNTVLSLDPYMRGRMDDAASYAAPVGLGEVMVGGTIGEVVASENERFKVGDQVTGFLGWQLYACAPKGAGLSKIDTRLAPASAFLGVLGMPGVTAWIGTTRILQPQEGKVVLVSAASGAVGSVAGQIAKLKGANVVGIAGGAEKCAYAVDTLGFDACVDYKSGDLAKQLEAATPNGVDGLFENVGGEILEAAVRRFNPFARVALCGLISQYNETHPHGLDNLQALLTQRVMLQGFIVSDHLDLWLGAVKDLAGWYGAGQLKDRETFVDGIENAPAAFVALLRGEKFGKQLVRLT